MPNTLAHIAVNGIATRGLGISTDMKWIYAGVLLPDVPWILSRLTGGQLLELDPVEFRSYCIVQSSLLFCLVLALSGAALSRRPQATFGILALGSLLHLLLDAAQTKWANGVCLFAPISWSPVNFGWFWPESAMTYLLTGTGIMVFLATLRPVRIRERLALRSLRLRSLVLVSSIAIYFLLPVAFIHGPIQADAHFLRTIEAGSDRVGKHMALDRARCELDDGVVSVRLVTNEPVRLIGIPANCDAPISVKGTFVSKDVITVDVIHYHSSWFRDWASYIGIGLIFGYWLWSAFGRSSDRSRLIQ